MSEAQLDYTAPAVEHPPVRPEPPQLRPYQIKLINDLYHELNQGHKRVAIIAGTGAGKTIISGQICAHAEEAGKRLMFLVHLDVLVGQTYEKMKAFGLQCGFIKAGWEENRDAPIQIARGDDQGVAHGESGLPEDILPVRIGTQEKLS